MAANLLLKTNMPRKPVPMRIDLPYHVSARCINREWFDLPLDTVWGIMEDYLFLISHGFEIRIHSFVLMANHFHLIVRAPTGRLSEAMLYFMRETSRQITKYSGRVNQTYGNRNHKTLLSNNHYFLNTYKYIYQNPLRANLCHLAEEYPYSTLAGKCGVKRLIIPVVEDKILFTPNFDESALKWLNKRPNCSHELEMSLALRKPTFQLATFRRSQLETSLL